MVESSMAVSEEEGFVKTDYVWGAKVGSNYKSVTIGGEVFSLGDCVRCLLKSRPDHIGKIVRLFGKDGKRMCRIRSFYSPSDFSPAVKGLDYIPEPKELFLAAGEGPGVEKDMLLEKLAGRCIILCTAEESFNEVPSGEQVEAADYFFRRGYDPAGEEVVGLDTVEEAIGAQKVYNKKEWLVPVDKTVARSPSQVSASRIHRQSPTVSGSSPRQGTAERMYASVPEVSSAPSGDSTERKVKKRKSDSLVPEPPKVESVEKINELLIPKGEMSATPKGNSDELSERLVFAIPAPSKINPSQKPKVLPGTKGKPPTSSVSKAKAIQSKGKGGPMFKAKASQPEVKSESLSVPSSPKAPADSKQMAATKEGAVSGVRKRKHENMPSTEGLHKKLVTHTEKSNASVERERPSKLQKRADEGIATTSSSGAEQKPQGPIFKPRVGDWDASNLVLAIKSGRVLLLQNLVLGLHSDELAEALTALMKCRCDVRIAPSVSSSYKTTSALLKLPSTTLASKVHEIMKSKHVIVGGRLVTTSFFKYGDFKAPSSKTFGHLEFPKEGRDYINEDYRDAVATSHLAQGNTIEFDYGLPWRVLDDQHEEQWKMLQEEFNSSKSRA